MKSIDIKIGFQCNNHCRFCIQEGKREIYPQKTTKEIQIILKKSRRLAERVIFTGGEPSFNPEKLLEFIKYAKDLDYKEIQIQSNGRIFSYKDYCREAITAGANQFALAVHGSNSRIHDYLTMVPGSWNQTIKGIKNLKSLNGHIITNSVITKVNYKDLPFLARLLVNLKVRQFQFAFMHINHNIVSYQNRIKEIVPRYKEIEFYVKKGLQIGIDAKINVMTEAIPYCFMRGYENFIAEKNIPDVHIFDATFEIENYTRHRKIKGKTKGLNCKKCKYFKFCEGPWREYPEIFGWNEFKPIINKQCH